MKRVMHGSFQSTRIRYVFLGILVFLLIAFCYLSRTILYVSPEGDDTNPGTKTRPLRSVTLAYQKMGLWGTLYLLPGIYRQQINIESRRLPLLSITVQGITNGNRKAIVSGSESSTHIVWALCNQSLCPDVSKDILNQVYIGALPWNTVPQLVVETTADGVSHKLPLARSPNVRVSDPNKFHEFWWTADESNSEPTKLHDTQNDRGLDPGNLTTVPDIANASAILLDGNNRCGEFLYERSVISHNGATGTITLNRPTGAFTYGIQENGIGRYTKYYLEDAIGLLDSPGEWFYDRGTHQLYLWPLENANPSTLQIEIGKRDIGFHVGTSGVRVNDVVIENMNDQKEVGSVSSGAVVIAASRHQSVHNVSLSNVTIDNVGSGVTITAKDTSTIHGVTVKNSTISHTSKSAILVETLSQGSTNIHGIYIKHSIIHDAGFPYNEPALSIIRASDIVLADNHIFNTSSFGIHITGHEKKPAITNNIRIFNNHVDNVCQNASSCAALKLFGGLFSRTVARQNTLENNLGWSYCYEHKYNERGFASGVSISNASGVTISQNTIINNSYAGIIVYPRQILTTHNVITGNSIALSSIGIDLETAAGEIDNDPFVYGVRHDYSSITNNAISNTTTALSLDPAHPKTITLDHNRYANDRIILSFRNIDLGSLSAIKSVFPFWEKNSSEVN